ncbi:Cytochrome b5 heme-binding domain-containing protein [Meloidogyne graminicola]|uniref:Cytochrome b5 heme-binding domain-containing protein n=1 Tax=Meloidogyne graminicola TaxID=189291 RepID=A0A8S9Z7M5_9BILA|nr:Cytochrome b5 heme-binding domain-containing protein [Meloidogyne graminicola]
MGRLLRFSIEEPFSKPLIIIALQIAFISALISYYDVELPFQPVYDFIYLHIRKVKQIFDFFELEKIFGSIIFSKTSSDRRYEDLTYNQQKVIPSKNGGSSIKKNNLVVFTKDQLALFDGSRPSKPIYLAILGRVFDVEKGKKHYGIGGGYNFFAGRDATRSFVTGDFSTEGLSDDVNGLTDEELLSIDNWLEFYEKDYKFVGVLFGIYYNREGKPTQLLDKIKSKIIKAKIKKEQKAIENEVFPPCNSEWRKETGGRVWCTTRSGGVAREWVGVPRLLFEPETQNQRCVCVKNFGVPLSNFGINQIKEGGSRGDLDNPNLREYKDCVPTANSCRLQDN